MPNKINNLKEMLMTFFWGNDAVRKHRLEDKVDSDIIAIALSEKFICLEPSSTDDPIYKVTTLGKQYRDK